MIYLAPTIIASFNIGELYSSGSGFASTVGPAADRVEFTYDERTAGG